MAQLVIHYLKRLLEREQLQQLTQKALLPRRLARRQALFNPASAPAAAAAAAAALPPPMLPGAWPLVAETCLHSQALQAAVVNGSMHGFVWTRGGRKEAPEINAFTKTIGSELTVKLSTGESAGGGQSGCGACESECRAAQPALVCSGGPAWFLWRWWRPGASCTIEQFAAVCTRWYRLLLYFRLYFRQSVPATAAHFCFIHIRCPSALQMWPWMLAAAWRQPTPPTWVCCCGTSTQNTPLAMGRPPAVVAAPASRSC